MVMGQCWLPMWMLCWVSKKLFFQTGYHPSHIRTINCFWVTSEAAWDRGALKGDGKLGIFASCCVGHFRGRLKAPLSIVPEAATRQEDARSIRSC